jgi:hypothetical protein
MRRNFGKYSIPPTLQTLIELNNESGDPETFYNGFHFYLSLGSFRYFNTPSDVIVFGNIGVHYGFLTDYGTVPDLESAPIVCVSPMDFDRPVKIVADHLKAFLRISLEDSALFYNTFASEADYLSAKKRWAEERAASPYRLSKEKLQARQEMIAKLFRRIELPAIDNPYQYVVEIAEQRLHSVTLQTQDGLGVTAPLDPGRPHIPFIVEKRKDPDPEQLQAYLASAPAASKLALFRDLQMNCILPNMQKLCGIVVRAMNEMGLSDEAARIEYSPL